MPPALAIPLAVAGGWLALAVLLALLVGRGIRIADRAAEPARRPDLRLVPDSRWSAVEIDTPPTTGSTPGGTP